MVALIKGGHLAFGSNSGPGEAPGGLASQARLPDPSGLGGMSRGFWTSSQHRVIFPFPPHFFPAPQPSFQGTSRSHSFLGTHQAPGPMLGASI